MEQPVHRMKHVGTDSHGRDEYLCKECGYHFIISWPPNYHREILQEAGDPTAMHQGSTAVPGFEMEFDETDVLEIDPYLKPFEDFLKGVVFDDTSNSGE